MEFLEVLTEGLERVLMVRGGGREVITIYSWTRSTGIEVIASRQRTSSLLLKDLNDFTLRNTCRCLVPLSQQSYAVRVARSALWTNTPSYTYTRSRPVNRRRGTLLMPIDTTLFPRARATFERPLRECWLKGRRSEGEKRFGKERKKERDADPRREDMPKMTCQRIKSFPSSEFYA